MKRILAALLVIMILGSLCISVFAKDDASGETIPSVTTPPETNPTEAPTDRDNSPTSPNTGAPVESPISWEIITIAAILVIGIAGVVVAGVKLNKNH